MKSHKLYCDLCLYMTTTYHTNIHHPPYKQQHKTDIGRTRTIPSSDDELNYWRFAFGSCKQVTHGFFNNLADIAEMDDLDMMVWLGDLIYEFPDTSLVNGMLFR